MIRPHYVPLYQSLCRSKKYAALPDDSCRVFFTLLLTHLDSWGRGEADAATLTALVWPMLHKSEKETARCLRELAKVGLIVLYEKDGRALLADPAHERFAGKVGKLERRGVSQWPPPPECRSSPGDEPDTPKSSPASRARAGAQFGSARIGSDPLGSEEEGSGEEEPARKPPRTEAQGDSPECIRHWEAEWARTRLGTKATIEGREGAAVAWMLKHADALEVRRRMTAMLEDADAWMAQNASLSLLRSKWDRYAVTVRPNREPTGIDAARSLLEKQRRQANAAGA